LKKHRHTRAGGQFTLPRDAQGSVLRSVLLARGGFATWRPAIFPSVLGRMKRLTQSRNQQRKIQQTPSRVLPKIENSTSDALSGLSTKHPRPPSRLWHIPARSAWQVSKSLPRKRAPNDAGPVLIRQLQATVRVCRVVFMRLICINKSAECNRCIINLPCTDLALGAGQNKLGAGQHIGSGAAPPLPRAQTVN
jgi:hypothetical protein